MIRPKGLTVLAVASALVMAIGCTSLAAMRAEDGEVSSYKCTLQSAQPVRLIDIERNPDRYLGRCIVVNAVFDGDELFASAHAARSNSDSASIVGAFIDYERWEDNELSRGRFSGILTDCFESGMGAVVQAESSGRVFLDVWVLGCQRGQRVHLVGLETADQVAVR